MTPPAPGRFSTISGCPLANWANPFDTLRDSVSAAPPAPTETSNRAARSGHCAAQCASARIANTAIERATKLQQQASLVNSIVLGTNIGMLGAYRRHLARLAHA